MQYRITLLAGVPKRQQFTGRTLVLLSLGAAGTLDMSVEINSFAAEEFRDVARGFRLRGPDFNGATFTAAVDCTIEVIVTNADISVNYTDGAAITATIADLPLPVLVDDTIPIQVENIHGDAPGNPVYVSGLTLGDTPAASMADNAAVAVTDAGAALLAADGDRLEVRISNIGADPVALGAPGITWAKRCVVLQPGDIWVEQRGAAFAWDAITATGTTASLTVQEMLA